MYIQLSKIFIYCWYLYDLAQFDKMLLNDNVAPGFVVRIPCLLSKQAF